MRDEEMTEERKKSGVEDRKVKRKGKERRNKIQNFFFLNETHKYQRVKINPFLKTIKFTRVTDIAYPCLVYYPCLA